MFQTREEAAGYLAGMIDGEGYVDYAPHPTKPPTRRRVTITNTDRDIVRATIIALNLLGIRCWVLKRKREPPHSDCWVITIRRQTNLKRLHEVVRLQSSRKQRALDNIVRTYVYRAHIGAK